MYNKENFSFVFCIIPKRKKVFHNYKLIQHPQPSPIPQPIVLSRNTMSATSPCPMCGQGAFTIGRSLSNHISRYCPINNCNKRKIDQISSTNCSHNAISSLHSLRQRQRGEFSQIASLSNDQQLQVSTNEANIANEDIINNNDIFDVTFDDASVGGDDTMNETNHNQLELCPFIRRSINLPPDLLFQVNLMHDLSHHRGNDLNLQDNVLQCLKSHATRNNIDFKTMHIYTRQRLIRILTKHYRLDFLKPILHSVPMSDGSIVTVPVFDVKALLISFLNDPVRMKKQNIASNYDIFTGKPKVPTDIIDEIHTGSLWEDARREFCANDPFAFPLGLVCFYDKTHTDVYGSLACAPFIAVPSFLNSECRQDDSNYMVFGYIPNLSHGKSKSNLQTSTSKLQDEHNCLSLITAQLKKINHEGGFWTNVFGRKVCVKVWIHFIAGDNSGHNNLVGHMNGGKPKYLFRDCMCENYEMSQPIPHCRLITKADIENARLSVDGLSDLCKKDIQNSFDGVPLSDQIHGLLGCVPSEMLHVSGTGILKYIFSCLESLIGSPNRTRRDIDAFDDLHRCMVAKAQRQSERDLPRMSVRNGITDGTKMAGSERVGNCFILLCLLHTCRGFELTDYQRKQKRIPMRDIIYCLKLYLSFERWVTLPHHKQDILQARQLLGRLVTLIKQCFPRDEGWGWNIAKMHAFTRMPLYMLKFGSATNFSGQIGERALKSIVKDHAVRTQRRVDKFAEQCAMRQYEETVIRYVMEDNNMQCAVSQQSMTVIHRTHSGRYKLSFARTNPRGAALGDDTVTWYDKQKTTHSHPISEVLIFAIRRFTNKHGYSNAFSITGYTSVSLEHNHIDSPVIYYASPNINGKERYDYAMIEFKDDNDETNTCPAKILGFIQYNITLGIPTPHFVELDENCTTELEENGMLLEDKHTYAVIHTASDYVSLNDLDTNFVMSFKLGDVSKCLYIVKIEAIHGPLFVFDNVGSDEEDKKFCTLPLRRWGEFFTTELNNV